MKRLVRQALRMAGLEIRRARPPVASHEAPRTDMRACLLHLASLGLSPATVIDVGAADGTPALLEVFPSAYHVLLEPLEEFEPDLRRIAAKFRAKYRIAAANEDGRPVEINVHVGHLHGSSLLREEMGPVADGVSRTVPGIRLDDLASEAGVEPPVILKVDVQGGEILVLRGGARTLRLAEVVILEVSFFRFLKGAPDFVEVVNFMRDAGFVPFDIFGLACRPLDGALGQADVAFVREDGPFRKDHRWAGASLSNRSLES